MDGPISNPVLSIRQPASMTLLTASKSPPGGSVPASRGEFSRSVAEGSGPVPYRREDDPFLDEMLLELTAVTTVIEPAPAEPRVEPRLEPRPEQPRGSRAADIVADEAMEVEEAAPRGRRIPVLGISLFALLVAAGAAYSSLRTPIGDAASVAVPAGAAAVPAPASGGDLPALATTTVVEADKVQERLPEWPVPPPLSAVPGATSVAALPPAIVPGASSPSFETTGSTPSASSALAGAVSRTAVNMRSGPDRNSPVVAVVAAGTPVEVRSCNFWCDVVVAGRQGWIYQDYLDGPIERRIE